jgi:murein DD-endopeptidase MepM/ murein hydrolase activator NlpD
LNKRNIIYLAALVVVVIAIIICLPGKENRKERLPSGIEENEVPVPEIIYKYGIPVDSFEIEQIKIKKNDILSKVLLARGINYNQIDKLVKVSKPVFDVRKIITGHLCTFFWTRDSIPLVKHVVYEKTIEEFITYSIDSTITVTSGRKEISYEEREVSGVIKSSLWKSLADMDVSPVLSLEMMDVYQWTLDFAGIQKGDLFQILYDVKMIDGKAVGINRVLASSFTNSGREHFAFVFNQNNRLEYFDEEGQSLRRAFLKAPLNYRRISSKYSNSRFHPIQKKYKPHRGIDYAAKAGTEVQTIGDGKVVKIAYDRASGNYIKIKHNAVYTSGYLHLQRRPKLNVNDYVKQGDHIGEVGATGYATGPHLDFRIWKHGQLVNPENVESPPVEPVAPELRSRYDSIASDYQKRLKELALTL